VRSHTRERRPRAQVGEESRGSGEEAGYPVTNSTLKGSRSSDSGRLPYSRVRVAGSRDVGVTGCENGRRAMVLAGQRRMLRQEPRLCDRGSSFRSPAVINVRYRTDGEGRSDQTAIEVAWQRSTSSAAIGQRPMVAAFASRLRRKRHNEKQAHKAELHQWENEGGNLARSTQSSIARLQVVPWTAAIRHHLRI
jgi:hypothetical protein